jgi:RNA polymerase sigma-70 factor (ECF subfamily)
MARASSATREALLATIPDLRVFAVHLCRSGDRGDDLVQEALLNAWAHLEDFREGTNMAAWLFTILRNCFLNDRRRHVQRARYFEEHRRDPPQALPEQEGWSISADLHVALQRLPVHQRKAVVLVGASGLSMAQAAVMCQCAEGTIKSRLNRGRTRLAGLLEGASDDAGAWEAPSKADVARRSAFGGGAAAALGQAR